MVQRWIAPACVFKHLHSEQNLCSVDGVVSKEIQWLRETRSHRPAGQNFQPPDKIHLAESESLPPDYTLIKSDICRRTPKDPSQILRPTHGFNEQILQQISKAVTQRCVQFFACAMRGEM